MKQGDGRRVNYIRIFALPIYLSDLRSLTEVFSTDRPSFYSLSVTRRALEERLLAEEYPEF